MVPHFSSGLCGQGLGELGEKKGRTPLFPPLKKSRILRVGAIYGTPCASVNATLSSDASPLPKSTEMSHFPGQVKKNNTEIIYFPEQQNF